MLAGSVPVKRFSPSSLPGNHQCKAEAAETDRAWATYKLAIDGIEKTKAGNRPVSEFRATFLRHRHRPLRSPCRGTTETLGRAWPFGKVMLRLLCSLGNRIGLAVVAELAARYLGMHASAQVLRRGPIGNDVWRQLYAGAHR